MSLSHRLPAALFWALMIMALAGLAPCLILPAWMDYQSALRLRAVRLNNSERLAAEVASQQKQITHLHDDEAYRERILHEEVGLDPPGIETLLVDRQRRPDERAGSTPPPLRRFAPSDDDRFATLTTLATSALKHYPNWTHVFILDETRPLVMGMSGVLLVSSILLLGRQHRGGRPVSKAQPAASN